MPAFVENGPDIPEHLLQAHEDGRVIFFCGAGISVPAGLPGFEGLVDKIYEELGATPEPIEDQALKNKQYDAVLHQLELRYPGGRSALREKLVSILKPDLDKEGARSTHDALLLLATDRDDKVRLVTTNFDRIFQYIVENKKPLIPSFSAPLLPIPKPSRWHGVVYLHGLLPETVDETELNRLVLTSGDFGLAYLTERWAARFVSELFHNYTVCFVGYGINDLVMRYMMDALAADELQGETQPEAYAFASYSDGETGQARIEWKAKGVTPLLYEVPAGKQDHSLLHRTLKEWASTYRDGARGKEMIIAQHASMPPLASSRSDFAVGRVLWALTDGQAAKHFADLNPVPPLEWLETLSANLFGHEDLPRFGITANSKHDEELRFSILFRPASHRHSPEMSIVNTADHRSNVDGVMNELARWLTRHLGDPKLIIWLADYGGQLHEKFARLIRNQIEELQQLDSEGKQDELDRIRANAPRAIPDAFMRMLWRFLLVGRIKKSHTHSLDLHIWLRLMKQDGLTPSLRLELRELLTPCVTFRTPFHRGEDSSNRPKPKRIKDLVDWELVLSSDNVLYTLRHLEDKSQWQAALPDLLQDFTVLLRDALDLTRELGEADEKNDSSYFHQASISEHPQNRDHHDWIALIELARDAWLATAQTDPVLARCVAEGWWHIPYPVFKRLAFLAAAQNEVILRRQALNWLLAEDSWWLWSVETRRESLRLLVALAPKLSVSEKVELEDAIMKGPPRGMFKENIKQEDWARLTDQKIWLRLSKLEATGTVLSEKSQTKLDGLKLKYSNWTLANDESDEFPFWMETGATQRELFPMPRRRRELVEWLKKHSKSDFWKGDDWYQRCGKHFPTTACSLCALAKEDRWPADRWGEALQVWAAESKHIKRSWRYIGPILNDAPDEFITKIAHALGWWLQAIAKTFEGKEDNFLKLCNRVIDTDDPGKPNIEDPVAWAINHPVGHATDALLRLWYRRGLEEDQELPEELKTVFTRLCGVQIEKFRPGRILLATHTVNLYRVDPGWASKHFLPLFKWQHSLIEARFAWEGFLRSPRLYWPLLSALKKPFLETAEHYKELGEHAEQYADFLTFVALDHGDTFTTKELADATRQLPPKGLASAAQTLTRMLGGAGDQRSDYWHNRVHPYLHSIWPKSVNLITPEISKNLADLCVAADKMFPDAWKKLRHWIEKKPVECSDYIVLSMGEAKLCEQFPDDALAFLNAVLSENGTWYRNELQQCLEDIQRADLQLANDARFIRLGELVKRGQA